MTITFTWGRITDKGVEVISEKSVTLGDNYQATEIERLAAEKALGELVDDMITKLTEIRGRLG